MKVLVTGSTGFVGTHLCERLHSEGHEVYALVRNEKKAKAFNVPGTLILGTLEHDQNHSWVEKLPDDLDAVIHTAGIVHHFDKEIFEKVNTKATSQLLDDLIGRYSKLKLVFISSLAACGPSYDKKEITEERALTPPSLYGNSKKKRKRFWPRRPRKIGKL